MATRLKHRRKGTGFLIDASVLIDYYRCDELPLFKRFAKEFGTVHVGSHTFELDAENVTAEDCRGAEIVVIVPDNEELKKAGELSRSLRRLGYADCLNIVIAKNRNITLITADKGMQAKAKPKDVEIIRGLRILIMLAAKGLIRKEKAIGICRKMIDSNPWMTEQIFETFLREIEAK